MYYKSFEGETFTVLSKIYCLVYYAGKTFATQLISNDCHEELKTL